MPIDETTGDDSTRAWSPDGTRLGGTIIVYEDHQGLLFDTVTGEHRPVYSSAPDRLRGFALSAIRRELYISRGPEEADIWIATIQPQ